MSTSGPRFTAYLRAPTRLSRGFVVFTCWRGRNALNTSTRLFDIVSEKELDWFGGPEGTLVYDEYLFALSEQHGLTA
jgi:hypothetical protein